MDSSAPLYFTDKAKDSRFFSSMRPEVVADLAAKPYARESHSRGLSLKSFDASPALDEEYEVLSLSTDPEGEVCRSGGLPCNPPACCLHHLWHNLCCSLHAEVLDPAASPMAGTKANCTARCTLHAESRGRLKADLCTSSQVYISTMESKRYPYTATQWHPEKNAFEWGDKLHIPHSRGAIEVTHAGVPVMGHSVSLGSSVPTCDCA